MSVRGLVLVSCGLAAAVACSAEKDDTAVPPSRSSPTASGEAAVPAERVAVVDLNRRGRDVPPATCEQSPAQAFLQSLASSGESSRFVAGHLTDGLGLLEWQAAMRAAGEGEPDYVVPNAPAAVPGGGIPETADLLPSPSLLCWAEGQFTDSESSQPLQRLVLRLDLATGTVTLAAGVLDPEMLPILAPPVPADERAEALLSDLT